MSIAEKFEIIADAVYDKGKQDEYDRFWDTYQNFGNKRIYTYAFGGEGWTDELLKPKYPIVTTTGNNKTNQMFYFASNVKKIMFPIYLYESSNNSTFYGASQLEQIGDDTGGGLWVTKSRTYTSNFTSCSALKEIRFIDYNEKGEYVPSEIGNDISFSSCSLFSAESLINIIKHLVQNPDASASERKTLSIHPTAFERLGTWGSPWDAGIDFDGGWSWYLESIGWDM